MSELVRRTHLGQGNLKAPSSGVNPIVRFIHDHNDMTYLELAKKSGLHPCTLTRWRTQGIAPLLGDIEAVLNAMGYDLVPVKRPYVMEAGDE